MQLLQSCDECVIAVVDSVFVIVPLLDDLTINVRFMDTGSQGEVVPEQCGLAAPLQTEPTPLRIGKAEWLNPEIAQVLYMARIGDQKPFHIGRKRIPQSFPPCQTTFKSEHERTRPSLETKARTTTSLPPPELLIA